MKNDYFKFTKISGAFIINSFIKMTDIESSDYQNSGIIPNI